MGKIIILCIFLFSCATKKSSVTIHNKSGYTIDSIFFPYENKTLIINIKSNETKKISLDISGIKSSSEGILGIYIYRNDRLFIGTFSYDELGIDSEPVGSHIFLFEKGYQQIDRDLAEPLEFTVFYINKSGDNLDSVTSKYQLRPNLKLTDSTFKMYLNYKEFKTNPIIQIYQGGKVYSTQIKHDWGNWNYNEEICYLHQNGVVVNQSNTYIFR